MLLKEALKIGGKSSVTKSLSVFYLVIILISGCKSSDSKVTDVNNIKFSESNSTMNRFENLLNNYSKKLDEISVADSMKWLPEEDKQYAFRVSDENVTINLYFTDSYQSAKRLAEEKKLENQSNVKWGLNGSLLFLVTGDDQWAIGDIASYMAGEE